MLAFLTRFKELILAVVAISASKWFLAYINFSPPKDNSGVSISDFIPIIVLIALGIAYRLDKQLSRPVSNSVSIIFGICAIAVLCAYVIKFDNDVDYDENNNRYFVIGYECNTRVLDPDMLAACKEGQNLADGESFVSFGYRENLIWTERSIVSNRRALVGLWVLSFTLVALAAGFLVAPSDDGKPPAQTPRRNPRRPRAPQDPARKHD